METNIARVGPSDIDDLLRLMEAYCLFYAVEPPAGSLRTLVEALLHAPAEGVQVIARDAEGQAVGFATVFWTWQTLSASRVGVMNDLFVAPAARGQGLADRLISTALDLCREHGAAQLVWQTALDNTRAQRVYDRVGAVSERWLDYSLAVGKDRG